MECRLGLLYVQKHTFIVDLQVIWLTVIAIVSRSKALNGLQLILKKLGASDQLLRVSWRREPLQAYPPPGSNEIVMSRKLPQTDSHKKAQKTQNKPQITPMK